VGKGDVAKVFCFFFSKKKTFLPQALLALTAFPSRDAIRRFIRDSGGRVGKREIARHFELGPQHRQALREVLRDLAGSGEIAPAGHKRFTPPGRLPEAMIVQVTGTDPDGDPVARPVGWQGEGPAPLVLMHREPKGQPALAPGQRVLARLKPIGHGKYEGRTLKRLNDTPARVLGVFRAPDRLVPTDRRAKAEWRIPQGESAGAADGEIVLAEPLPSPGYGLKPATIIERLGDIGDARSVSLICIHTHDIPTVFSAEAIAQAKRARGVALGRRTDLRDTPLITIDGEDARDFDDAVYAEPDGPGFRLIVAIADVAHYVRPGTALDRDARLRGNSCYFPDRVVPMLPEALSNGWCSLRPDEDRGCLFVEMFIDAEGRKTRHRFARGLMRSAARLTYDQTQAAFDAGQDLGLPAGLLPALYAAFRALLAARQKRGTLDLDLPERRVSLDDSGKVASIAPRPRLDSHRLIEEFMVLANVAAAEELERLKNPCMYRIHAPPSDEKLAHLRQFLGTLGISLPPGPQVSPRDLDQVLRKVAGSEHAPMVNEVMLRSQAQAAYSPDNIGHFGLSLSRYAHFTSPIRRYADLLVHRALVSGLRLGLGGLSEGEIAGFEDAAEHISATERRAALAERDAIDRYLAAYMADKIGACFESRISGVTRFGLFVTVHGNGATGLIPLSSLPDDYWLYDEATQSLIGRKTRQTFRLTQDVTVRLAEASPVTGGLIFALTSSAEPGCAHASARPAQLAGAGPRNAQAPVPHAGKPGSQKTGSGHAESPKSRRLHRRGGGKSGH
jgi:ribonuclease R